MSRLWIDAPVQFRTRGREGGREGGRGKQTRHLHQHAARSISISGMDGREGGGGAKGKRLRSVPPRHPKARRDDKKRTHNTSILLVP